MSEQAYTKESSESPLVRFNISRLVEVSPEVEEAAQSAATAVWRRHVGTPTSVNMTFANAIHLGLPNGGSESVNSLYNKDTDTIGIALGTLQERHPELTLDIAVVLHAGHETRHKVQTFIGDEPADSNQQIMDGTYTDSRHEIEAWQSSIEAYTDVYPGHWVNFSVGQRTYPNRQA